MSKYIFYKCRYMQQIILLLQHVCQDAMSIHYPSKIN